MILAYILKFGHHSADAASMGDMLLNVLFFALIAAILLWVLSLFGLPARILQIIGAIFAVIIIISLFAGCATDTGNLATDRRGRITNAVLEETFNSVLSFGIHEGASLIAGQNGQDAAGAAFQAAQAGILSVHGIQHIVAAAAGPQVAAVAAQAMASAAPQSPQDAAAVANTIGAALQQASNQLAAR